MKIRFWGVRGSIASPGPQTDEYGGNTACVEVIDGDRSIIIDGGTGIRDLGDHLLNRGTNPIYLFLSHFHFDHICGLPFFRPLYRKGVTLHLYGPQEDRRSFRDILSSFFAEEFFPIPFSRIPAKLELHGLHHQTVRISPFVVRSFYINHPGRTLGYLVTTKKGRVGYLCDHEPIRRYRHLKKAPSSDYERRLLNELQGVDLLIHDAQFTDRQYPFYRGWGHSPWSYAIHLASAAKIKRLILFHHAPENEDATLTKAFRTLTEGLKRKKTPLKVILAREGETIRL